LETGIANQKRAENPPQPLISQSILGTYLESRYRNVGSVKERDSAKNEKPECEKKSLPGVLLYIHW
jgi:hypothetical protein